MSLRRVLGAEMLLIGLLGLVMSIGGAVCGYRLIDRAGNGLDSRLDLALQSLDTAKDTLLLARTGLGRLSDGLDTAERTAVDMSRTIDEARPLLGEIAGVVSSSAPDAMDAFRAAVADMSQAAAAIDSTLATLRDLSIERSI
jgi:hypothetical protein